MEKMLIRLTTLAALACALAVPPAQAHLEVQAPIDVSGPLTELAGCHLDGDDNTPRLAVDPRHPRRVLLTYLAGDTHAQVARWSRDGGATWQAPTVFHGLTGCTGGGPGSIVDPGAFIGRDGTAYSGASYVALSAGPTERNHDDVRLLMNVARSDGPFAQTPSDIDPTMPDQRSYFAEQGSSVSLVTERSDYAGALQPGPTSGYVYGPPNDLDVLTTADSGRTWRQSTPIGSRPGHNIAAGGLVAAHGALVAVAADIDWRTVGPEIATGQILRVDLLAYRSTDGGRRWSAPTTLATQCGACSIPDASTASDGTMLVSWVDQHADGSTGIELARSTDGGVTWQMHTAATAHRATSDQLQASPAESRDGALGVLYYDGSRAAGAPLRAMLAVSSDAGAHWSHLALSSPMSYASVTNTHEDTSLGPYISLVGQRHGFLAAYTALAPFPLNDGQEDVVAQRVTGGEERRREKGRAPRAE
jgi:hypothetical protein